jgi:hypothetical protein
MLRSPADVKRGWRTLAGLAGLAAAIGVDVVYARSGFRPAMPWLLVGAVVAIAFFFQRSPVSIRSIVPGRGDLRALAILTLIMAPLYWWQVYSIPWQVNTDEATIIVVARRAIAETPADLFGISPYFGFPSAVFVFVGRLAEGLGGIDLYNSRLVHSTLGIVCVLLGYGFFRQLMAPLRAATLAVLLGANHALFAISRMAMRENTGLLLELLALLLLVRGFQRRSKAEVFLAGVSTGLAFYAYFPGRIGFVIVLGVLAGVAVLGGRRVLWKLAAGYAVIVLLGWGVVAAPVIVASRANSALALGYARQQFLIYPEGRKFQQELSNAKSPAAAWKANIRRGLTTFNSPIVDQGNIYWNPGHGFVDPLTGVLLWVGLAIAGVRLVRNRARLRSQGDDAATALGDLTAVTGFLTIYLSCALVITKAPNYTRLLVVLPFVSYLAGTALWQVADWLGQLSAGPARRGESVRAALVAAGLGVIVLWNVSIFGDLVAAGRREGHDVGSTGRYVEAKRYVAGYTWIVAADDAHPYYSWGAEWQWRDWVGIFAGPYQATRVSPVAELSSLKLAGNFTIFISNTAWQSVEADFRVHHPLYEVNWLTPDARLLAVDVRRTQQPAAALAGGK